MKKFLIFAPLFAISFCVSSCHHVDDVSTSRPNIIMDSLSTYEQVFAHAWLAIDSNYVFFHDDSDEWNKVYEKYLPLARACSNDRELRDLFIKISTEECNGNIFSFINFFPAFPIVETQDSITTTYRGFKCDEYYTSGLFSIDIALFIQLVRPIVDKNHMYDVISIYPMVPRIQTNLPSFEDLLPIMALTSSAEGTIIDIRGSQTLDAQMLLSFLPCCFDEGETKVIKMRQRALWSNHTAMTPMITYKIEGNGIFSKRPIAIIVNEATRNEASMLAHILSERENVAIIGRVPSGGGNGLCSITGLGFKNYVLHYPTFQVFREDGTSYAEPVIPDSLVQWDGWERYKEGGYIYYNRKADPCVLAAMNFIDTYNSK